MNKEIKSSELPYLTSIVITNYNQGRFFKDSFESAMAQTYVNKEIIIVDDGSTDDSVKIIKQYLGEYHPGEKNIKLVEKTNGGTASARNAGINHAGGNFIAFLDIDDFYYPEKIAVSVGKLAQFDGLGVAYTDYDTLNEQTGSKKRELKPPFNSDLLMQACIVSTNSVVARDVFTKIGMFDESIRGMEDYEFWLRVSTKYSFCHIPFSLFCYREHGLNKTLTTDKQKWFEEESAMKQRFINKYLKK